MFPETQLVNLGTYHQNSWWFVCALVGIACTNQSGSCFLLSRWWQGLHTHIVCNQSEGIARSILSLLPLLRLQPSFAPVDACLKNRRVNCGEKGSLWIDIVEYSCSFQRIFSRPSSNGWGWSLYFRWHRWVRIHCCIVTRVIGWDVITEVRLVAVGCLVVDRYIGCTAMISGFFNRPRKLCMVPQASARLSRSPSIIAVIN